MLDLQYTKCFVSSESLFYLLYVRGRRPNGFTLKCQALASCCFKGIRRPLPAPNKVTDPHVILCSVIQTLRYTAFGHGIDCLNVCKTGSEAATMVPSDQGDESSDICTSDYSSSPI